MEAAQQLSTVEAMKTGNILRAEKAGTVGKVLAKAEDALAVDAATLHFGVRTGGGAIIVARPQR